MRNKVQARKNVSAAPSFPQVKSLLPVSVSDHYAPFLTLDSSVDGAAALLVLLSEKIAQHRHELGIQDDLSRCLCQLADTTAKKLRVDFDKASAAFTKLVPSKKSRAN